MLPSYPYLKDLLALFRYSALISCKYFMQVTVNDSPIFFRGTSFCLVSAFVTFDFSSIKIIIRQKDPRSSYEPVS